MNQYCTCKIILGNTYWILQDDRTAFIKCIHTVMIWVCFTSCQLLLGNIMQNFLWSIVWGSKSLVTECESQGSNGQRLAEVPRRRGFLTVVDCFYLGFGYMSKTARIQQRTARILKRRYTSHTQVERLAKTLGPLTSFLSLPLRIQAANTLT